MKKLIVLLLAAVMVMALVACGGSDSGTTTPAPGNDTQTTTPTQSGGADAAAPAAPAEQIVLSWNEVNGDGYGATEGAKAFKAKLEEVSGGAMTIELYTNGTLGDEKESMQGIQMGTLDIFRGNASSLPNYGAETIGLTGLPFMFKDMEQFKKMADSSLGQELLDSVDAADCGYVALTWLVEGPRQMFITPATYAKLGNPTEFTIDMMKGLKIRVPETDLMVNTMKALGASATPIAYAELYTSLQSNVVDGAENGVTSYVSNSFNEVAPYFITDAHTFGCGVVLMNKDKWNSLTAEQQGWMKEACAAASEACYAFNAEQEQAVFDSFAEKGITRLDVPDLAKWQEACASVYAGYDADLIARLQSGNY
ncbi:MAG: TRAP transporter substrate-binding protein [Oscillospiraceae bacterium]|nr:TRAP transporter substrate-binding protein [Oscillospiraceae bacterium]